MAAHYSLLDILLMAAWPFVLLQIVPVYLVCLVWRRLALWTAIRRFQPAPTKEIRSKKAPSLPTQHLRVEIMDGLDAVWILKSVDAPETYVNLLVEVDGATPKLDGFRRRLASMMADHRFRRLSLHPELCMEYYFWVPDEHCFGEVDGDGLEEGDLPSETRLHSRLRLDSRVDFLRGEDGAVLGYSRRRDLETLVADVCNRPFPSGLSPWEMRIIPKRCPKSGSDKRRESINQVGGSVLDPLETEDEKPGYALYFRFNHCLMDGVSLVHIFAPCFFDAPEQKSTTFPSDHEGSNFSQAGASIEKPLSSNLIPDLQSKPKAAAAAEGSSSGTRHQLRARWECLLGWWRVVLELPVHLSRLMVRDPDGNPLLSARKAGFKRLCLQPRGTPLEHAKRAAARHGCSLNEVLLSALARSCEDLIRVRGLAAGRAFASDGVAYTKDSLADSVMSAAIPVSFWTPLDLVDKGCELKNKFSMARISLPLIGTNKGSTEQIEDPLNNAVKRLMKVASLSHTWLKGTVGRRHPQACYLMSKCLVNTLPAFVTETVVATSIITAVFSNVRGPAEKLYLFGEPVTSMTGFTSLSGRLTLGFLAVSYAGSIFMSACGDLSVLPDHGDAESMLKNAEDHIRDLGRAAAEDECVGR